MDLTAARGFLASLHDPTDGTFAFSPKRRTRNVLSTALGVLASETFGEIGATFLRRDLTAARLLEAYDGIAGTYAAPRAGAGHDGPHDDAYRSEQAEDFVFMALEALGQKAIPVAASWDDIATPADVVRRLESLRWAAPSDDSNRAMFLCNAIIRREGIPPGQTSPLLDAALDWFSNSQDADGLWSFGTRADRVHRVTSASHFVFFYSYAGRPIPRPEQMLTTALTTQHRDGLFTYSPSGGACEDVGAIDLIVRARPQVPSELRVEAEAALSRARSGLTGLQGLDGGFCWALHPVGRIAGLRRDIRFDLLFDAPRDFKRSVEASVRSRLPWTRYAPVHQWACGGMSEMLVPRRISDVWSTWLRMAAIGLVDAALGAPPPRAALQLRSRIGLGLAP